MGGETHPCPACGTAVLSNPRYPGKICRTCRARVTNAAGEPVEFDYMGPEGFAAVSKVTGERVPTHLCYIDGATYWAMESRQGGIVICAAPDGVDPRG